MILIPRPYQIEGADFLAAHRHALLADEMRVGKTPQAIMAAAKVNARRVLVNCPAIAVTHWEREFHRWWGAVDYGQGDLPQRLIVSYDRARMDAVQIKAERWNVFIPDEAHFAKNPEAQRTKLVYGKDGFGWQSDFIWSLSGTPAPKHAGELWPMLRAFGVVGMTYDEFCKRYCKINSFTKRITGTREEHIPELKALLAKVMLRRMRKEVAPDMPEIGFDFLEVAQPGKIDYKIPAGISDDGLLTWLEGQRHANKDDRQDVALAKVGALSDEIDFALGNGLLKQTVVFGWHVEPLKKMTSVLRARGYRAETITGDTSQGERDRIQREFREGTIDVVDAQILAAGTAIDMSAARHAYFLELDWVPGNNAQAANRLISMDKMDPVTIDVVTWPKSSDEKIQRVLLQRVQELSKLY